MKRKVFWQLSVIVFFLTMFFILFLSACLVLIIVLFKRIWLNQTIIQWIYFIATIGGFIFGCHLLIRLICNRIIFNEKEIFIQGNRGNNENKMQYETHIKYNEIKKIFMVLSLKNSLNKNLRQGFIPMPYIIFECENNQQKAINVLYYSKKQVKKIIDEAVYRAKEGGNILNESSGTEILNNFIENKNKYNNDSLPSKENSEGNDRINKD